MKKDHLKIGIIVGILMVVFGLISGLIYNYYDSSRYVATVLGERVSKEEFQFFLASVKSQMESTGNLTDETAKKAFWESAIDGKDVKKIAKDRALDKVKEFKIQYLKAKESNVKLDKEDIDKIDKSIATMVEQVGGEQQANEKLLEYYKINKKDYRNIMLDLMLVYKFMKSNNEQVSKEELIKYYEENLENKDKVTVRHILISTLTEDQKPLSQEEIKKKKIIADEVLDKAKKNGDMSTLAKEYSDDPGSKNNAGQYTFSKGEMVKEFEDWAFKAKPGDVGLIKTNFGYHIIKKPTFEELGDIIKTMVSDKLYSKRLEEWKKDKKYDIKINQKVLDAINV